MKGRSACRPAHGPARDSSAKAAGWVVRLGMSTACRLCPALSSRRVDVGSRVHLEHLGLSAGSTGQPVGIGQFLVHLRALGLGEDRKLVGDPWLSVLLT